MDRSGMKTVGGKPVPKTIDAIKFGKRYLDPNDSRLRLIDIVSVGIVAAWLITYFIFVF